MYVSTSSPVGRRSLAAWWCRSGHRNEGTTRVCHCGYDRIERHAQIHSSERAIVFENPLTGERRIPPRADMPMDPKYAAQGFQVREIMSMSAYEKETGLVHEATNFALGSEPTPGERFPTAGAPKEVIENIVNDIRAAHQSGDWTMAVPLAEGPRDI